MPFSTPTKAPHNAVPPSLSHRDLGKHLSGLGEVGEHQDVHVTDLSTYHDKFSENIVNRIIALSNATHQNSHLQNNLKFVGYRIGGIQLANMKKDPRVMQKSQMLLDKVIRAGEFQKALLEKYVGIFADGPALSLKFNDPSGRFMEFLPVALIVTNRVTRDAFKNFLTALDAVNSKDATANAQSPLITDVVEKASDFVSKYEAEVAGLSNSLVVTASLERMAGLLESKGLTRLASMIDSVSNSLENKSRA